MERSDKDQRPYTGKLWEHIAGIGMQEERHQQVVRSAHSFSSDSNTIIK